MIGRGWGETYRDPTAGVRLMPATTSCPRCGVVKGRASKVRPGLCHDCSSCLAPHERLLWAA